MTPVNGKAGPAVLAAAPATVVAPERTEAALQVQNNTSTETVELTIARDPDVVLAEAQRAAVALKRVIDGKPHPVRFGNETYLEFEDWTTIARFYNVTARVRCTAFVEFGTAQGFEATADVNGQGSGPRTSGLPSTR